MIEQEYMLNHVKVSEFIPNKVMKNLKRLQIDGAKRYNTYTRIRIDDETIV